MAKTKQIPTDLRERKRQVTLDRITEVGLKLFAEKGYEATTLDAIAMASGISRRTFFYYLKSKEDVLVAHDGDKFARALRPTFLAQSPRLSPITAARKTFLSLAAMYETRDSIVADRILQSIETLRLRKEALLVQAEEILADAMYELWPEPARRPTLRMQAMMALGTLRIARENWRKEDAAHPLTHYIEEAFAALDQRLKR